MLLLLHVHCVSPPTLLISHAIITAFAYDYILFLSLILALSSNLKVCLLMFEFHLANINAVVRGWTRLRDHYNYTELMYESFSMGFCFIVYVCNCIYMIL